MNATIWCATLVGWIEGLAAATGRPVDATTLEPATLAASATARAARPPRLPPRWRCAIP
ncbi:hypothetical protein [Burkholderia plantarii]|uniref:hypothetical protein n=1 Tax=Burkholderia plantarii TaxID=41899 RepID=UPI001F5B3D3E|nr:hypothetical protein [Burkholderia plantarii]